MTSPILSHYPEPGILHLTLNRPEKRNALSLALLEDFCTAIEQSQERVIIVSGAGPAFCAGLDLEEASTVESGHRSAEWVARALEALYASPAVTIAAVQGSAMAGGAGLIAACDLAIAAEDAQIGFPETRRGLVAALVSTILYRRLAGRYISELLLVGEPVTAQRAYAMGLVNDIVPSTQLTIAALALAKKILSGAPQATMRTKRLIDELHPKSLEEDLAYALGVHREVRSAPEAQKGVEAFLDKSKPKWTRMDKNGHEWTKMDSG